MKVNLGSGDEKLYGFVNCDYDKKTNPDKCFDFEKDKFPFETNSVETLAAFHILEHLGDGFFHCIKEIYRICKHGAIIHIKIPHPRSDNFLDDPTHRRPITVRGLKMLSKKYSKISKEQSVRATRLADYLDVDLEVVSHEYTLEERNKPFLESIPPELVEQYMDHHFNLVSEIYVKMVVLKDE